MPIILIGFMAAGKSSIAKLISDNFVDTDDYISQKIGMTLADYIEKFGMPVFRQFEEEVFAELIASNNCYELIATGGGIVESEKNQTVLLEQKNVVYLKTDFEAVLKRISTDVENKRPIFENLNLAAFRELFEKREKIYENLADITIDTSDKSLDEVSNILKKIEFV